MDNPYALYKHNSSEFLYQINLNKKNYAKALEFLIMSDKKFKYYADCANAAVENDIRTSISYSKCYSGLGDIDDAINVLMPYIFPVLFGGVKEAVNNLVPLLKMKYGEQEFKKEIESMCDNVYIVNKVVFTKLFEHTIRFNFNKDLEEILFEIKLEKNQVTDDEIKDYVKNKLRNYYFYKLSNGGPVEHYDE
jgi:hypothetical protein